MEEIKSEDIEADINCLQEAKFGGHGGASSPSRGECGVSFCQRRKQEKVIQLPLETYITLTFKSGTYEEDFKILIPKRSSSESEKETRSPMPLKKRARMMEVQYPLEHAINKKVIHRVPLSLKGCKVSYFIATIAIRMNVSNPMNSLRI